MKNLSIAKLFIYIFVFKILLLFVVIGFIMQSGFRKIEKRKVVKGESVSLMITPAFTPTPTLIPTSSPPAPIFLKKELYSIAIFGDSMVDTMGEKLEHLQEILASKYPQTKFNLYNYGVGGQNVEQGLARFENSFVNRERQYPPIPALIPDILIIGSFAYNPFSTHDRNKHYILLKDLITKAKNVSSNVYLLAEIAPLKTGFGKGKNGVNMPEDAASEKASQIIEQLDDVINLSIAENIPLINVYYNSRIDGSYGNPDLVNKDDGIHPSFAGHSFTAELIAEGIRLD